MPTRHRLFAPLAACLGVLVVAGCVAGSAVGGGPAVSVARSQSVLPASSPSPSPPGVNVDAFRALAGHEASAWPQSPLGKIFRPPAADLGPLGKTFVGTATATVSGVDGRTLELTLPVAPCDPAATWGGLVAEVGAVVVVGGWIYDPHPAAACTANLILVPVIVHLAAPLGDRVILDAATGMPVTPVTPVTPHFAAAPATAK